MGVVFHLQTLGPLVAHAEVIYGPSEAKSALLALSRHMRDAEEQVAPLAILGSPPSTRRSRRTPEEGRG